MNPSRFTLRPTFSLLLTAVLGLALAAFISPLDPAIASPASNTASISKKKVVLKNGHIDAVSAKFVKGKFRTLIKDATKGNTRVKWRNPESAVIALNSKAKVKLPAGMGFVGRKGSKVWLIPQTERRGVIWAGWNTESVDQSMIDGDVTWTLRKIQGPGKVVVFQTGSFGESNVIFNSGKKLPQRLAIPVGVHAHGNWAFTKKGNYRLRYTMSAKSTSGSRLSDTGTLNFRVR